MYMIEHRNYKRSAKQRRNVCFRGLCLRYLLFTFHW